MSRDADDAAAGRDHAALWHALGLGPRWLLRDGAGAGAPDSAPPGDWDALEAAVAHCTACRLAPTRTQTVFGVGSRRAPWLFVGEGPGAEEDARGEPFVGQAGRLLDNLLAAGGLGRARDDRGAVYIANVVKCRPPGNRNPEADEVRACAPFLRAQIALLEPRLIVAMGRCASQLLLASEASVGSLRGRLHSYAGPTRRIPVVVTYHPAYLLRNLADKGKAWEDLCLALDAFEREAAAQLPPPP